MGVRLFLTLDLGPVEDFGCTEAEAFAYGESLVQHMLDLKATGSDTPMWIEWRAGQLAGVRVESTGVPTGTGFPPVPCQHCGALRDAAGVRSCGADCVRGVDPRAVR